MTFIVIFVEDNFKSYFYYGKGKSRNARQEYMHSF